MNDLYNLVLFTLILHKYSNDTFHTRLSNNYIPCHEEDPQELELAYLCIINVYNDK